MGSVLRTEKCWLNDFASSVGDPVTIEFIWCMQGSCIVSGESMTLLLFLFGDYIWFKGAKFTSAELVTVTVILCQLG